MLFMLVFLFCLSLASVASAEVILTDNEARTLENNFKQAKALIVDSKNQLKITRERLTIVSDELDKQKQTLIEQKILLANANKSLELQNKELKKEIHKVVRQRNFAYTITAVCLVRALSKK